jgi:transcription initiation factor TFIIIB Brf1 subunit/transcription initiation factor TFIIB
VNIIPTKKTVIEQVPTGNSLPSRQDVKAIPKGQQRRHRTGRNQQINIKATGETIDRINRIADELRIPLGAVLERALDALEKAI